MTTRPAPLPTLFGALGHALSVVGIVLIVAALYLAVTIPRALVGAFGLWLAYRVGRLTWYAFRHDARRFGGPTKIVM